MIKNIINLTKIFLNDLLENPYLIDKKTKKSNKKSIFTWLIIIVMITITFLSFKIINILIKINQQIIFLNVFFLILNVIIIFQIILASINVYFSSKDLELILPLPIKTEELLIAKFNTVLFNIYFSEFIFALFPLIIYGISTNSGILYYIYLLTILIIFPVLANLVISTIIMFLMKISKIVKNKDIFQVGITLICIIVIFLLVIKVSSNFPNKLNKNFSFESEEIINGFSNFNNKIENINKYFLITNPIVKILNNYNKINSIIYFIKIILINLLFFILFIFTGKKYYLKNILKNKKYIYNKKIDIEKINKKIKKESIKKSYIKKEFKTLFRNSTFFIQCIFPTLMITTSFIIMVACFSPNIKILLTTDIFNAKNIDISVDLSIICLIVGIIQIIFTISNISISAISREGKDAIYIKYIPVDLYKQFVYKNVPQVVVNMVFVFVILGLIKFIFPIFNFSNLLFLFVIGNLLNIVNSNLMILVDLYKPNLNWKSDYEAIKNDNKLFQYVLTIIIILLIVYFFKIFEELNLELACLLIILILFSLILIINKIIKINIKKLFKKIN